MRRILGCCLALMLAVFTMPGCGASSSATTIPASAPSTTLPDAPTTGSPAVATTSEPRVEFFTRENWPTLDGSPDDYVGSTVDIVGRVFNAPDTVADGVAWQMWADPKNNEWNTLVLLRDKSFQIKDGDYVRVRGTVTGGMDYQNVMGGTVTATGIVAESAEVVDATAAASPASRVVELNKKVTQHALIVAVTKIEFADDETRVHLVVTNNSGEKATFYDFNAKAVQGKTQFEPASSFAVDYPEVQSELLPGIESSGVVVFPRMESGVGTKLLFEAHSADYSLDFEPYVFDIPAN